MSMTSQNSASSINITVLNIYHTGQRPNVITWMAPMAPSSHRTSRKIPHFDCTTKICAAFYRCHSKRRSSHATMFPATDSHHPKKCLPPSIITQTIFATVHKVNQTVHHTACSMCRHANTVWNELLFWWECHSLLR